MKKWTEEKITIELQEICDKLNRFPTADELRNQKKHGLLCAAIRYKGLSFYRSKLGFEPNRKPQNYWDENFEKELKKIIKQLSKFPSYKDLIKLRKNGIVQALHRKKFTLNDYRIKFGYKIIKKTKNYWMNWNNLETELKSLIVNNIFPTLSLIKTKLGGGATKSIFRFGGITKVAKKMGYKPSHFHITTDGHYVFSAYEQIFDEYLYSRNIPHDANKKIHPNHKYKYDFKVNDIYFEIWGFDTRNKKYIKNRKIKEHLYKELNLKLISIEYTEFLKPISDIEKNLDSLFASLNINTINKIKNHLNSIQNDFEIWNEEKITNELKKTICKIGHFPKNRELGKLYYAVRKYGGINYFANKLEYECKKPPRYWNDDKILEELLIVVNKIKHFPTTDELTHINRKLLSAICEFGGISKFKKLYFQFC